MSVVVIESLVFTGIRQGECRAADGSDSPSGPATGPVAGGETAGACGLGVSFGASSSRRHDCRPVRSAPKGLRSWAGARWPPPRSRRRGGRTPARGCVWSAATTELGTEGEGCSGRCPGQDTATTWVNAVHRLDDTAADLLNWGRSSWSNLPPSPLAPSVPDGSHGDERRRLQTTLVNHMRQRFRPPPQVQWSALVVSRSRQQRDTRPGGCL